MFLVVCTSSSTAIRYDITRKGREGMKYKLRSKCPSCKNPRSVLSFYNFPDGQEIACNLCSFLLINLEAEDFLK